MGRHCFYFFVDLELEVGGIEVVPEVDSNGLGGLVLDEEYDADSVLGLYQG